MASWKKFTASEYFALRYALTPLLRSSRDFSLLHPVPSTISAPASSVAQIKVTFRIQIFLIISESLSDFSLRRHEPNFVDLRTLGDINRARHRLKVEIRIALDEDHALGARL